MEIRENEYIRLSKAEILEKFDDIDKKIVEQVLEKLEKTNKVAWNELDPIQRTFLKLHGLKKDIITCEDIAQFAKGYVSSASTGDEKEGTPNVNFVKNNFSSDLQPVNQNYSNEIFYIDDVKACKTVNLNVKDSKDVYNIYIKAISKAIALDRKVYALPVLALYMSKDYITRHELNEEVEKINENLEKKYSSSSLAQAVSRVLNNSSIVETKIVKGVRYYKLLGGVKKDILNQLTVLMKEEEIREQMRSQKITEREEVVNAFIDFFRTYSTSEKPKYYISKIIDLFENNPSKSLIIDFAHLMAYNPKLADLLIENPEEVLLAAKDALNKVLEEDFGEELELTPRFVNLPRIVRVKDVGDAEHINKFIQVEAVTTRVGELKPMVMRAVFVCKDCGNEMIRLQKASAPMIKVPKCDHCGSKNVELDLTRSTFIRFQTVRFQELPNNMKPGEPPRYIDAILTGDLVNVLIPGARVRVTGILRLWRDKSDFATFKKLLEVNGIEVLDQGLEDIKIEEEDISKINALVRRPDLEERVIQSVAPVVHGYDDVKLGLALAMFGGTTVEFGDGTRLRGESHVLLVGDPSTAKSTMARWTINIAPRGVYTSGRGATSAGITAAAVYDELSKSWMLEGGALVLADQGVAIIDELDKLTDEAKKSLHEALEHGTVSVSKAGINANLNARTTLIGAANPKYGRFNRAKPLIEQIDLDPALISRFDLIFVFLDDPDKDRDYNIAMHILKMRNKSKEVTSEPPIPTELFRKWIAYARLNVHPRIPEHLWAMYAEYYAKLRDEVNNWADEGVKPISITTRQLEAMIRLSQARARMFLREEVTEEDIRKAKELIMCMLKQLAVDESGNIDISILEVGRSARELNMVEKIIEVIKQLDDGDYGAPEHAIISEAKVKGIEEETARKLLKRLFEEGQIYVPKEGFYRV